MANLRMNQNLPQVQATNVKLAKPNEDKKLTLEERVELVKDGKEDPNAVLADLGVKNVQVKNVGKNRQNLTFEVNGKRISVTGTSPEDLAAKAGELLAEELGNGEDGEQVKDRKINIGKLIYVLICLAIGLFARHKMKKLGCIK